MRYLLCEILSLFCLCHSVQKVCVHMLPIAECGCHKPCLTSISLERLIITFLILSKWTWHFLVSGTNFTWVCIRISQAVWSRYICGWIWCTLKLFKLKYSNVTDRLVTPDCLIPSDIFFPVTYALCSLATRKELQPTQLIHNQTK